METEKLYTNQIQLTSQFRFCGNSFRVDTYRGCDFGCIYCFANNRNGKGFEGRINYYLGDDRVIENYFKKIDDGKSYADINVELMRNRVPFHLGGMADPFQSREWQQRSTYKLLKLSKQHKYPMVIRTKTAHIPEDYFEYLDPELHAFQVSLIYFDDPKIAKLELNTPKPLERLEFLRKLHDLGFWVSVRIQPLVSLSEAEKILDYCNSYINFCTVEHLKLPKMNDKVWAKVLDCLDFEYKSNLRSTPDKPEFELNNMVKLKNINHLKGKFPNLKFGCGDNDLHEYSDSLNCCGIDTMPASFGNWLKYNSMYIKMTGDKNVWVPQKSCSGCFNSGSVVKGYAFKDYVDAYYLNKYGCDDQLKLF